ncbi:MAG: AAA family ATPase [Planctomycetes bacterium]|nr:AAA family ATPase [Planctomycetota bacterium]
MPGERRFVTVLFADLSGFTRLSEAMDPEDVQELMDALFQTLRPAIEAHGGTVDKFIGDAVMAVFGAPAAHEDDPLRAVRAALAVQQAVRAFNAERVTGLKLRVGLNAGEVLWGKVGGDRETATGDAVNVAQRLEGAAAPGTVLVSKSVERATASRVRYRALGAVQLKGREESVEAFEAVAEFGGMTEYRLAGSVTTPFVGRTGELARLEEQFGSGKGVFVGVEGEAGVGKSRLLAEFRRRLRDRADAPEVYVGRALEAARLPFGPFAEALKTAARAGSGDAEDAERLEAWLLESLRRLPEPAIAVENYAHLVAHSLGLAPAGARIRHIEPSRLASETRHAWARWLESRAADRPVVLCLEDLHWAEPSTEALLAALPAALMTHRVMIVATRRPGGSALPGFEALRLEELGAEEAAALAQDVLRRRIEPGLAEFLAKEAGGNPLYVEELARHLDESGRIEGNPARLAGASDRVPQGLQGVLTARLDALAPEEKEILKAASAVGRVFWSGVLEETAGDGASRALHAAARRRLVAAQPGSLLPGETEYAFRHALIRDAAYALLPKRERSRLHAAAAAALEKRFAAGGRRAKSLAAGQREAAGQPEIAARLWEEVAREAASGFVWEEGLAAARDASRLGAGPEAGLLEASLLGKLSRVAEAVRRAEEVRADPRATPEEAGRAALAGAHALHLAGDNSGALRLAEEVLAAGPGEGLRVRALAKRADALVRLGRLDEGLEAQAAAREAFRVSGEQLPPEDRTELSLSIPGIRAHALFLKGDFVAAHDACREVVDAARVSGNLQFQAAALGNLGLVLVQLLRHDEAAETLEQARAAFERVGDRWGQCGILQSQGVRLISLSSYTEAESSFRRGLEMSRAIGNRWGESVCLAGIGFALVEMLRSAEAGPPLRESLRIREEIADLSGQSLTLLCIGRAARDAGAFAEAVQAFERSRELALRAGSPHYANSALNEISETRIRSGEFEAAEQAADLSVAEADAAPAIFDSIWARTHRARARLARGDARALEDVREAARVAVGLDTNPASGPFLALSALAEAIHGDPARAREHLSKVRKALEAGASARNGVDACLEAAAAAAKLGDPAGARSFLATGEDIARAAGSHSALARLSQARAALPM